jgi:aspartate kinase
MIVMKFGGTSTETTESIRGMLEIVRNSLEKQPILIFSAMGKTTRNLLDAATLAAAGNDRDAELRFGGIKQFHRELAEGLLPDFERSVTRSKLDEYFEELQTLLRGLSILGELPPRSQDKILSYGELIATTIIVSVLSSSGIDAEWLDTRKLIVTNDEFTKAKPFEAESYLRIGQAILTSSKDKRIPVLQGFIGATRGGCTTTLGFEGSDFTAALVGAALEVADIQVWKEVPGIMTADPAIVEGAYTVKTISFDEAAELAFLGAKVLHPSSIEPARQKDIPVHILNSRCPDNGGTEISSSPIAGRGLVKSIAYKRPVSVLRISGNHAVPSHALLKSVFDTFDRERIVSYVMTSSGYDVVAVVGASEDPARLIDVLSQIGKVSITGNRATVSLVGNNIGAISDIQEKVFQNLRGTAVDLVSHGASPHSFTVVVHENDVAKALERLHDYFFKDRSQLIFG